MYKPIYYKGAKYMVDYEHPVDSDEVSSVHTSEDEFVKDDAKVRASMQRNDTPKEESKIAHIVNKSNIVNVWGRKQVFMVSSFNDWVPIEMKTVHEIKMERKHGNNLSAVIEQDPSCKECENKPSQNLL